MKNEIAKVLSSLYEYAPTFIQSKYVSLLEGRGWIKIRVNGLTVYKDPNGKDSYHSINKAVSIQAERLLQEEYDRQKKEKRGSQS